jgi:hypothetical protein
MFSDPFGLSPDTVKFEGERKEEVEAAWNKAKLILGAGAGNGDRDAAAALDMMETAEASTAVVTFRTDLTMNTSGQAINGVATVNPDFVSRNRDRYYLPLTVGHEFGHAWAQKTGRVGYSETFALGIDNTLRNLLKMTPRQGHWDRPLLRGQP